LETAALPIELLASTGQDSTMWHGFLQPELRRCTVTDL
jgi:hypothetical protein